MRKTLLLIILVLCTSCGNALKYLHKDVERAKFIPLALSQGQLEPGTIVDDVPMVVTSDSAPAECFTNYLALTYQYETQIPKTDKIVLIDLKASAGVTDFLNESYIDSGIQLNLKLDIAESVEINYGRTIISGIYTSMVEEKYLTGQLPPQCERALIVKGKPFISQALIVESLIYRFYQNYDGDGDIHVNVTPEMAGQIAIGGELGVDYFINEDFDLEIVSPMVLGYRLAKFSQRLEYSPDYLIWTGAYRLRGDKHRYESLSTLDKKVKKQRHK